MRVCAEAFVERYLLAVARLSEANIPSTWVEREYRPPFDAEFTFTDLAEGAFAQIDRTFGRGYSAAWVRHYVEGRDFPAGRGFEWALSAALHTPNPPTPHPL